MQRIEQDIEQARLKFDSWKETHTMKLLKAEEKAGNDATENEGKFEASGLPHSPANPRQQRASKSSPVNSASSHNLSLSRRADQKAVQRGAGPPEKCEEIRDGCALDAFSLARGPFQEPNRVHLSLQRTVWSTRK